LVVEGFGDRGTSHLHPQAVRYRSMSFQNTAASEAVPSLRGALVGLSPQYERLSLSEVFMKLLMSNPLHKRKTPIEDFLAIVLVESQ